MLDYDRLDKLKKLVAICQDISACRYEMIATTVRTYHAEKIFQKATLHGESVLKLWTIQSDDTFGSLDSSSIASISRNIIEVFNIFEYLCEKDLTKEELDMRIHIMSLHYTRSLQDIVKKLDITTEIEHVEVDDLISGLIRDKLETNNEFSGYPGKIKKTLLKGEKAYYWKAVDSKYQPLDHNVESGIYNLLSNSVHSFPLGFSIEATDTSERFFSHTNLLKISLEVCILYLASIASLYIKLRPKVAALTKKEHKEYVKNMKSTECLMELLK